MKIRPSDIDHFSSARQAAAYQSAQRLLQRHELVKEAVLSADNADGVDFNVEAGKVVLPELKLPEGVGQPGTFRGEATFDPASGKVGTLFATDGRNAFEQYDSKGFLGLGQQRTVVSHRSYTPPAEPEGRGVHQWEEVALFADGSLDYHKTRF